MCSYFLIILLLFKIFAIRNCIVKKRCNHICGWCLKCCKILPCPNTPSIYLTCSLTGRDAADSHNVCSHDSPPHGFGKGEGLCCLRGRNISYFGRETGRQAGSQMDRLYGRKAGRELSRHVGRQVVQTGYTNRVLSCVHLIILILLNLHIMNFCFCI